MGRDDRRNALVTDERRDQRHHQLRGYAFELARGFISDQQLGSGGSGVFLVDLKEAPNITQIVEVIARDGYVITQEYLPKAKNGDVRMFVMNGRALEVDGVNAAFRRRPGETDIRSNMSAGGSAEAVKVTDEMLQIVEAVRPKLLADGLFLVGLDIVGDKLMEVNVFSPGGLGTSEALYGVDFSPAIIEDLERKIRLREHYGAELSNIRLATMCGWASGRDHSGRCVTSSCTFRTFSLPLLTWSRQP